MGKLRKAARGRECMVRLPYVCNRNSDTVVLAHYRLAGYCGVGLKPSDLLGAWACSSCHDICDGRAKSHLSREEIQTAFAEGVMRTIAELEREGLIKHG